MQKVLKIISDAGLTVSFSKCDYVQPVIDFFGHRVRAEGIWPLPICVQAILTVGSRTVRYEPFPALFLTNT